MWDQNSSGYFWTETCSSGHFPARVTAKRLFLHKWKPILSSWGKGKLFHLLKSSLSKWKYLFSKSHPRTFSGGFRVVFFSFSNLILFLFKELLKDFYHAKGYSTHPPFVMPWILHVPVLNTPGFNLKLNVESAKACAVKQKWQSSLWQTKLA